MDSEKAAVSLAYTHIAKARGDNAALSRSANQVEARARAMSRAIKQWLDKYRRFLVRDEIERQLSGKVSKADTEETLFVELERVLRQYGLRQLVAGGGTERVLASEAVDRFLEQKTVKLQAITAESRDEVRRAVGKMIQLSLREVPQPSVGEIARRIRTTFGATPGTSATLGTRGFEMLATDATEDGLVLPTVKLTGDGGKGELYAFSSERAALIARTELVQAQNTGHMEGLRLAGFTHKKWLAYTGAMYPSGAMRGPLDRHHDLMNGKVIPIDEPFILPDKTPMMYPGDPDAPIKHLANCRCSIIGA